MRFISFSGFDHHDGIRIVVVGQTLKRARVFTAGWKSVS
jgi:hypothetical protein